MAEKGKSIIEVIKYLDSFYNDVGLMFGNLESLLSKKGFMSHPTAGNRVAFSYGVSGHIGNSQRWALKNIQRMYLKEEEIDSESKSLNKVIFCSLALYPSSAFEMPVLVCGVMTWDGYYSKDGVYNLWSSKEICDLIIPKNNWRLKDKYDPKGKRLIFEFVSADALSKVEKFSLFFVDAVKIENANYLQEIVDAIVDLYNDSEEILLNPDLIVDSIPEELVKTWTKPIVEDEKE
jgi:hypothetical protein